MVSALVPIANGSEEIEAVCIIDTLRRAGIEVTVASVHEEKQITASRRTVIVADVLLSEVSERDFDIIALPGGQPGANNLRDCPLLIDLLRKQKEHDRIYAAVCASPAVVFATHGLITASTKATAHPSVCSQLPSGAVDQRVVVDGKCVTSRGPGTSIEFALKLIEITLGVDKAREVQAPMLVLTE